MEDYEEYFDYDASDESLNMFLFSLIRRLDIAAKRHLVATFLDAIGTFDKRDPLNPSTKYVRIRLSKECKYRAKELVEHVEMIFFYILPAKQKELYKHCLKLRDILDYDMTGPGYIELLNTCNTLVQMTGLPFSIEEDYGGLKTWDAWNTAIEKAIEECKVIFGRKKRGKK